MGVLLEENETDCRNSQFEERKLEKNGILHKTFDFSKLCCRWYISENQRIYLTNKFIHALNIYWNAFARGSMHIERRI